MGTQLSTRSQRQHARGAASVTEQTATTRSEGILPRVRRAALWLLFALLLVFPKMIRLRRSARAWNALRVAVALLGAGSLALGVAGPARIAEIIAGILLLALALLIPPERAKLSVDQRARELGAFVAVDGGRYQPQGQGALPVRLFVGPQHIWILDAALRTLREMPLAQLETLRAEPAPDGWRLLLMGRGATAELGYRGPFAEHLARVAESTVRSQLRRELPILR
jgi:hypothetical protein